MGQRADAERERLRAIDGTVASVAWQDSDGGGGDGEGGVTDDEMLFHQSISKL